MKRQSTSRRASAVTATAPVSSRRTAEPATARIDEDALKLWVVLARAYSAVAERADAHVARHGLTGAEFGILEVLYHKGPRLRLGEIQQKLLVTSGGITYLVDRLAAKGLVARRDCPEDRRVRYAELTPAGRALIARIFPEHAREVAAALGGLTKAERAQATDMLRALGRAAAGTSEDGSADGDN